MADNPITPMPAAPSEAFDKLRQRMQQQIVFYDNLLRRDRYRTLILQGVQIAILVAISVLAFTLNGVEGGGRAAMIALLAALAIALSGYLFGYEPQIRWGQYLEARRELSRRFLEMDVLIEGAEKIPPERVQELSQNVSLFLERPFGLAEVSHEDRLSKTPA
jgi:uncharacterized protein HemX